MVQLSVFTLEILRVLTEQHDQDAYQFDCEVLELGEEGRVGGEESESAHNRTSCLEVLLHELVSRLGCALVELQEQRVVN